MDTNDVLTDLIPGTSELSIKILKSFNKATGRTCCIYSDPGRLSFYEYSHGYEILIGILFKDSIVESIVQYGEILKYVDINDVKKVFNIQ